MIISVLSLVYAKKHGSTIAYREWVRIAGIIDALIVIHFYSMKEKEKRVSKLILRIAIVKEKVTNSEYLVEDVLNKEIIRMVISGKMRMNYIVLNVGDKVGVTVSSLAPNKGRLATRYLV